VRLQLKLTIQEPGKFYKRLNVGPRTANCYNKDQVFSRWKEFDIDLPSREEIEGRSKYLKNNKAAGSDSISAELLKNDSPNMVDALHEMILQAWTSETTGRLDQLQFGYLSRLKFMIYKTLLCPVRLVWQ
jgi:hypothetical protein